MGLGEQWGERVVKEIRGRKAENGFPISLVGQFASVLGLYTDRKEKRKSSW